MAIDMKNSSTMGCAYFSTTDGVLHLSEDIPMATLDVAEQFLFHVEPTTVLISARAPEEFQQYVEKATIPAGMPLVKHQFSSCSIRLY
jgi:DNA mismatch repair protein MSH5